MSLDVIEVRQSYRGQVHFAFFAENNKIKDNSVKVGFDELEKIRLVKRNGFQA